MKHISSTQNPLIKELVLLKEKSRHRKKKGKCIIEGLREITIALKAGYLIETLFYQDDILEQKQAIDLAKEANATLITLDKQVYQKIAYRETTEGVIALVSCKNHEINQVVLARKNPLILIAEAPEKPGNIGALLRTADAANIDLVCIANPKTDLYNPNIIRSSVGCVFSTSIAMGSTQEILDFLTQKQINIYSAALSASVDYHTIDYTKPSAIVVGTEATGLSQEWLAGSTQNIIIPMQGAIDSMNVSVAAAVITFEAKRQRNFL